VVALKGFGADLNSADRTSWTPLMQAARDGLTETSPCSVRHCRSTVPTSAEVHQFLSVTENVQALCLTIETDFAALILLACHPRPLRWRGPTFGIQSKSRLASAAPLNAARKSSSAARCHQALRDSATAFRYSMLLAQSLHRARLCPRWRLWKIAVGRACRSSAKPHEWAAWGLTIKRSGWPVRPAYPDYNPPTTRLTPTRGLGRGRM